MGCLLGMIACEDGAFPVEIFANDPMGSFSRVVWGEKWGEKIARFAKFNVLWGFYKIMAWRGKGQLRLRVAN